VGGSREEEGRRTLGAAGMMVQQAAGAHAGASSRPVRQDVLDAVLLARLRPGASFSREEFAAAARARPEEVEPAIAVLGALGLLTTDGDRVHIAPCELKAVLAHLARRRELEIRIARAAALNADDAQLKAMTASQALQKRCALVGDMDGMMVAERQLEQLLAAASGLAVEAEELSRVKIEFRRSWCAANRLKTFSNVADIRTALVASIVARDPDAAEAQIHVFFDHLLRSY
jgi:DNA-binding GntR family transcriptional regulator